jgi:hypothetical protein
VVVAPTIAAVGLSFYSYGFPRVGTCLEIGVVQILLVIMFSLVSLVKLNFALNYYSVSISFNLIKRTFVRYLFSVVCQNN